MLSRLQKTTQNDFSPCFDGISPFFNMVSSLLESSSETLSVSTEGTKFSVPMNKKDKPKRNRSAFIIFSSEVNLSP